MTNDIGFSSIKPFLVLFVLLLPALATGQSLLEEVVVTASKRDAVDLQSTAATITAFTGSKLEEYGFDDFEDYANFTPGLSFQKTASVRSQFIIRGVTLGRVTQAEPQNRSVVGLYLNDVPVDQNGLNVDPDLFDLERVEILKGPQGSLFGDSAMAGAVRYVTKRPGNETIITDHDLRVGETKRYWLTTYYRCRVGCGILNNESPLFT